MPQNDSILRFENVGVAFATVQALKNVSFDLKQGQTGIILGAAGGGKTVLLKTAIGLNSPSAGKVFLFGQEIQDMREAELYPLRRRVGILFQEGALFDSMTVEQNVAYPLLTAREVAQNAERDAAAHEKTPGPAKVASAPNAADSNTAIRKRIQEALDFVELGQTLKQLPAQLSGGMQRRVAIARAVVANPPLLLYDSPTAGLDPITAYTIVALIIKERDLDNTTALVVTHRYQDGNLIANFRYNPDNGQLEPDPSASQRTIFMVMREGRLVFEGSQQELEASTDGYVAKFIKKD